jgi:hypothetical protein
LRPRSAKRVEQDGDDRAADGEAKSDPQRDAGTSDQAASDGGGEVRKDRSDHECRHCPQQLDDREDSLEVRGWQRETRDEQRGGDARAKSNAGQPGPDERERLARRELDSEYGDSGGQECHSHQREVVHLAPLHHGAERERG